MYIDLILLGNGLIKNHFPFKMGFYYRMERPVKFYDRRELSVLKASKYLLTKCKLFGESPPLPQNPPHLYNMIN